MTNERGPVPVSPTQWSEARGFARLYHSNPHYQARLFKALCGYREKLILDHAGDKDHEAVGIIDQAIREFAEDYPDFLSPQPEDPEVRLGPYEPDSQLLAYFERHYGREASGK
jgi:hypothetical protein